MQDKVQIFAEILNGINQFYVDPVDLAKITETGFNAMLQSLDPYTEFENPRATTAVRARPSDMRARSYVLNKYHAGWLQDFAAVS